MADKIDQLKIGSTLYDIDLPKDATPSVATVTATGAIEGGSIKKTGGTSSQFLKADGSVDSTTYLAAAIPVTYSQLATLINNNQLIAGSFYRITDFVTTTAQARTQSAGHAFDLIVHAISTNQLSEDANATQHSGDTYFANSQLGAWVLKYCFTNDTNRFSWADTTNGKGVIYYMKDEFFNEFGYDFKNIKFARYKITVCANCADIVGKYYGVLDNSGNPILTNYMTLDTTDYIYYYSIDCCGIDYSLNPIGTTLTASDGRTFTLNQIQCIKCYVCPDERDTEKYWLNNFVLILEGNRDCMFQITQFCTATTFLGGCSGLHLLSTSNAIIGGGNAAGAIDGYVGQGSSINGISTTLVYCKGTAITSSIIGRLHSSCIVAGAYAIAQSNITLITASTIISTSAGGAAIYYSILGSIASCNLTSGTVVFYNCNITYVYACTCNASGASYYAYSCVGGTLRNTSLADDTSTQPFLCYTKFEFIYNVTATRLYSCEITLLRDSNLKGVAGCTFNNSQGINCDQNLDACTFELGVNFLTISSTDTTQTIARTHFHDIAGVSGTPKVVVIPEDYSQKHTVDIYSSAQLRVYEID